MQNSRQMSVWLIGAGPMAGFHADVLAALGASVTIIATSSTRASPLAQKHGMAQFTQGYSQALAQLPHPDAAVIALPVDQLSQAALELTQAGVPRILIEKPGAINAAALDLVRLAAATSGSQVFVAYNRRFFSSVQEARRRIARADSVLSVCFEFCEDSDRIAALTTPDIIKQNWVLANSSHVIDLAFHLCGRPATWQQQISGRLPWHSNAADFRGMGARKPALISATMLTGADRVGGVLKSSFLKSALFCARWKPFLSCRAAVLMHNL